MKRRIKRLEAIKKAEEGELYTVNIIGVNKDMEEIDRITFNFRGDKRDDKSKFKKYS